MQRFVYLLIFTYLFFPLQATGQQEGQSFCDGIATASYFPLTIKKKNVLWAETAYFEKQVGEFSFNGKRYVGYTQEWKSGSIDTLYLRSENDKVYQYQSCCSQEDLRYDARAAIGDSWQSADGQATYTVVSKSASLETPFCSYTNLLQLRAQLKAQRFDFFYLKGYGYIGATFDGQLISAASPK